MTHFYTIHLHFNYNTLAALVQNCISTSRFKMAEGIRLNGKCTTTTTTILRPSVRDYLGELVAWYQKKHSPTYHPDHHLYQLLPSTTIHSILLVQITCLAIFLHNLFPCPLWSTSWSGALHLIFHTFLHPVNVFFSQHVPIPSQLVFL